MAKRQKTTQCLMLSMPETCYATSSRNEGPTLHRAKQLAEVGDDQTNRFLSVEPLWEEISLAPYLKHYRWVIVGGESKQDSQPNEFKVEWS
jgi:protein gp37